MTHAVAVVGAGPTGMMLAAELALAGIDVGVVERRADATLESGRAGGLHARSIEVLDQRGVAERFLAEGQVVQALGFPMIPLDIGGFPSRHPYVLGLWQHHIERILAGWLDELPVTFHRGVEVTGLAQDDDGVALELSDGRTLRAAYVVGCDGGRSFVRKAAGIAFPGSAPSTSALIAEVEMTEEPELGTRRDAHGLHALGRLEYEIVDGEVVYADAGPVRVMLSEEPHGEGPGELTLDALRARLVEVYGTDFGAHSPTWISRFTDASRQADAYRAGRVLLAGDAAHIHSPVGGQGLNTGLQDAVNLGWKLAQVVRGVSPDALLDTYHAERHPIGAQVLRLTMAMTALNRTDDRTNALRTVVADLLGEDAAAKRYAGILSGLGLHYDLGPGHPLLGRRMPDLDLDGGATVYGHLHAARPVLLDLTHTLDIAPWADRVQHVRAGYDGEWDLPVLGAVDAPSAVLVRPDGHVAWVGDGTDAGLTAALERWFGPPRRG